MERRKSKAVVIVLILTMVISIFAACDSAKQEPADDAATQTKTEETKPEATEVKEEAPDYGDTGGIMLPISESPITLECFLSGIPDTNTDGFYVQEIEKRTNIKLDITIFESTAYNEKIQLLLASRQLPDYFESHVNFVKENGLTGAFVAINEYLDILPNFSKVLEERPMITKSYSASDGNIYFFPYYESARVVNHGMLYRKDIFDKNGLGMPDGPDSWYNSLKKLKEIYPESTPLVNKYKSVAFSFYGYSWGTSNTIHFSEAKDKWEYAPVTEEFKTMIEYFTKLYDEGILDPEFMTSSSDDWTAKMIQENQAFATFDWVGRLDLFYDQVKENLPEYDLRYAYPVGPTGMHVKLNDVSDFGPMVSSDSEYIEDTLKLIDYLYSPSGSELSTMGIEGVTYEFDENGKAFYPELEEGDTIGIEWLMKKYGLFVQGIYVRMHPKSTYFDLSEKVQEGTDLMVDNNRIDVLDPILTFTAEESEQKAEIEANLTRAMEEYITQVIYGMKSIDSWNEWESMAEQLGYKELEGIYAAAYSRYLGN